MIGLLSKAMPHPPAPSQAKRRAKRQARRQMAGRCLPVLASLLLLGCRAGDGLPNVLYLGVEVNPDETIDANLLTDIRQRLGYLEAGYRQLHPNTRFQVSLYPEQQLAWAIQRRNRAGLAPDLLLLTGDTAVRLLEAGLIEPFPQTGMDRNLFDPQVLDRLSSPAAGHRALAPLAAERQQPTAGHLLRQSDLGRGGIPGGTARLVSLPQFSHTPAAQSPGGWARCGTPAPRRGG